MASLALGEPRNYFCTPELLSRWAESSVAVEDLFGRFELQRRKAAMGKAITDNSAPAALRDPDHEFWRTVKRRLVLVVTQESASS